MINFKQKTPTQSNKVWLSWLKSEWPTQRFDCVRKTLINPFSTDKIVLQTLKKDGKRHFLIDELPDDVSWYRCKISSHELKNTFILPSKEWLDRFPVSLKVEDVFHEVSLHKTLYEKVQSIVKNQDRVSFELVLISKGDTSSYTILEGNHRALALMNISEMAIDVYIGHSPIMSKCKWYTHYVGS